MYNIVAKEIAAVNGLGANGENLQNWMPLIEAGINAGTTIATTAINAKNQPTGGTVVTGGSTTTYAPTGGSTYRPTTTTQKTDYTPWIIAGGIGLLALVYVMSNNNKRR